MCVCECVCMWVSLCESVCICGGNFKLIGFVILLGFLILQIYVDFVFLILYKIFKELSNLI